MRWSIIVFSILTSLSISISCIRSKSIKKIAPLTDPRDNKAYTCKQIGNQTWMVENLAYKTKSGKSTFYASDSSKYHQYGHMYFSEDVQEATNIPGWHLPDSAEWMELLKFYHLDKGIMLAEQCQEEYGKWELEHLNDIALFLSDDENGFNYQFGGLWHQKFIRPGVFEKSFEYRKHAGYYWADLKDSGSKYDHIGMGQYKNYWIELSSKKPFHTKRSKDEFRFCIRLVKDK